MVRKHWSDFEKKHYKTGSNVLSTWCCALKLNTIAFHWQASCHNWTICSKCMAMAPYPHSSALRCGGLF